MTTTAFDRDSLAKWYAQQHLKTDPGLTRVCFLPTESPLNEIRFVEVNKLIASRMDDSLEAVDFGVDVGADAPPYKLLVLDVTPEQWKRIKRGELQLPAGWTLDRMIALTKKDAV